MCRPALPFFLTPEGKTRAWFKTAWAARSFLLVPRQCRNTVAAGHCPYQIAPALVRLGPCEGCRSRRRIAKRRRPFVPVGPVARYQLSRVHLLPMMDSLYRAYRPTTAPNISSQQYLSSRPRRSVFSDAFDGSPAPFVFACSRAPKSLVFDLLSGLQRAVMELWFTARREG